MAQLLFVFFVLREEFAFMFETFSGNDPPGKAPPSRGRSEKEEKNVEFGAVEKCAHLVDSSTAYFLAIVRFDTAENEPAKKMQKKLLILLYEYLL